MWNWLREKYECDYEVKRFYHKGSSSFYTSLDIDLVKVPVFLLITGDLHQRKVDADSFSIQYIQVKSSHNYGDFKKRVADVVS
jgi:hypothetical protein